MLLEQWIQNQQYEREIEFLILPVGQVKLESFLVVRICANCFSVCSDAIVCLWKFIISSCGIYSTQFVPNNQLIVCVC